LSSYSNDLRDALLSKHGNDLWKCWNSKIKPHYKRDEVDGYAYVKTIAGEILLTKSDTATDTNRATCLNDEYANLHVILQSYQMICSMLNYLVILMLIQVMVKSLV
jgi:hypothetical protein